MSESMTAKHARPRPWAKRRARAAEFRASVAALQAEYGHCWEYRRRRGMWTAENDVTGCLAADSLAGLQMLLSAVLWSESMTRAKDLAP